MGEALPEGWTFRPSNHDYVRGRCVVWFDSEDGWGGGHYDAIGYVGAGTKHETIAAAASAAERAYCGAYVGKPLTPETP